MRRNLKGSWVAATICAGMLQGFNTFAQGASTDSVPATPAPAAAPEQGQPPVTTSAVQPPARGIKKTGSEPSGRLSPFVVQVLKLLDAGVSQPVIQAYIEQTPITQPLSAADILALKEKGIPDGLTVALLKRAAATPAMRTAPTPQLRANSVPPPQPNRRQGYAVMDPESYEFWWYHYAYPRALAAANERLFSSYRPFLESPNDYGYYPPFAFPPQPPMRRFSQP